MLLTRERFETIKRFILQHGDRQTYCNMYNKNPHYGFDGFDAYLNPEGGQENINCEPDLSDFDELVVRDKAFAYFRVKAEPGRRQLRYDRRQEAALTRYFEEMLRVAGKR